jgi:hypothetical protein
MTRKERIERAAVAIAAGLAADHGFEGSAEYPWPAKIARSAYAAAIALIDLLDEQIPDQ